jgi:hypothetical protein
VGVYQRGNGVNVVQRFWTIDPVTGAPTLADPTTVVFTVLDPAGVETEYAWNASPQVQQLATGVFLLTLPMPLPQGTFTWECVGAGAVAATGDGTFTILPSGVLAPEETAGPTLGPCAPWISGEDVARNSGGILTDFADVYLLDDYAYEASAALFEISGRRFTGRCGPITVRPCRNHCSCWAPASLGLGPWYWTSYPWGVGAWGWYNEMGDRKGCQPLSRVRLAGYPVREIVEVKIDGQVLPPVDDNGNPNYRLDLYRDLIRMGDPGAPPGEGDGRYQPRHWPGCQDMDLDDTEVGTFSITYYRGVDPPQLGRDAAAQLAVQLYLSATGSGCQLPAGTTRVTRQGVEVERGLLANWFDPTKATGIPSVDLFLRAYFEQRSGRPSLVFSPDLQQHPVRMT